MAMSDWLLVRLARDGSGPLGWVAVSAAGQLLDASGANDPAGLAEAAAGRRVALVVPSTDVLHLAVTLPSGSDAKLAQIVPFAVEEQVADDIDNLHCAVGRPLEGPGSPTRVDVVSRALLEHWLAAARAHGLSPVALHAEAALVPAVPGQLSVLIEEDTLLLRSSARPPLTLPSSDAALALELALAGDAPALAAAQLTVYASAPDWEWHAAAFEALRPRLGSMRVQLLSGGPLPFFAMHWRQADAINLLQGPYAPVRPAALQWRAWRLAAGLGAGLLALHLLASGVSLRRLHATEQSLDGSIREVFSQAMPGELSGGNARARMQQRLAQVQAAAPEQGSLMAMLVAVASAHGREPATRIGALSYRKGTLDMKVTAPDVESLERMNQALRAGGYAADLASGSAHEQSYEGRLQLRSPGT
jgi:general secretion pathway protein L